MPEIYDGTVMIRGAVREAGDRAKVAVYSRERDVDPVGACVGMQGTRVQSIIRELRGEKIDIVEWSEDPVTVRDQGAQPGQGPARDDRRRRQRVMEVVVEDRQLSLAIGKKGQNVRLAAKLTGWKIDIKSEEEKRREVEAQLGGLEFGDAAGEGAATASEPVEADVEARRSRDAAAETRRGDAGRRPEQTSSQPAADAEARGSARRRRRPAAEREPTDRAGAEDEPPETRTDR